MNKFLNLFAFIQGSYFLLNKPIAPFLFLLCSVAGVSQNTLNNGITACYALNGSGAEAVNALTGTLSMVTPTVDRFNSGGMAVHFGGNAGSYIRLPNSPFLKPANAVSFSVWIKPDQSSGANIIYTRNNLSSNFEAYQLGIYAGAPVFRLNKSSSAANDIVLSTTTVVPNNWYHLVATIDNNMLQLFVNGTLEGTAPSSFPGFDYMPGREVILGNSNEFLTFPLLGTLDNLRFYDRVLTQSEVLELYSQDPACQSAVLQPVAAFSVSAVMVCEGKNITLTDLSLNAPTSWAWQVSGPMTLGSALQHPSFVFNLPGVYKVTLTASNSGGSSVNTATQSLVVLANPTVSVSAGSPTFCAGQQVTLTANGAASYTWSNTMNAGSIVVSPNSTFVYAVTGSDANGCAGTATVLLQLVESCISSISESDMKRLNVFPNPFAEELNFKGGDFIESISFVNYLGKEVLHLKRPSDLELKVNTSELPAGLYLILIQSRDKRELFRLLKK